MSNPTDRDELIDWCLRRLGAPVIEINVAPEQLEDRVDEALQLYQEYHDDATRRTYLKHVLTQDDIDNGYIEVSDSILHVSRLWPVNSSEAGGYFGVKYQLHLNDLHTAQNFLGNLAYYEQMQQYLELLDMTLNSQPRVNFQRHGNRIYIHGEFEVGTNLDAGDYLIFDAVSSLDPETHTEIYNDMWLKEYLTALIKQQWGQNLSLFGGMQLPGGVTIEGPAIKDEATAELERLRIQLREEFETPPMMFVG